MEIGRIENGEWGIGNWRREWGIELEVTTHAITVGHKYNCRKKNRQRAKVEGGEGAEGN